MYGFTWYSAVILAIVPGMAIGEQKDEDSAVLVKISPFISKSKKIIQFSGDKRYKRHGPEKSALYLEFPESFFADPKLKRLYSSLIGGGSSGNPKESKHEKTDFVFQIDPSAFGEKKKRRMQKKRDVRGGDLAAFQLTIAPAAAHVKQMGRGLQGFVPRHETTKLWCVEKPLPEWSADPVMHEGTTESSVELVTETMCYPSKPSTPKLRICGGTTTEDFTAARPNDPCQCQRVTEEEQQQVETTPYDIYTQCKSQDPIVTHYVESMCFTTERCSPKTTFMPYAVDIFSTTYKMTTKPSCPPSSLIPTCGHFRRFFRKRRKDNQLRNFFVLSNSPQSCPPFCPQKCTRSPPKDCAKYTKRSTTSSTTSSTACTCPTSGPTTCTCPDTPSTTCSCPDTPSTTCSCPLSTSNHKDHVSTTCLLPTACLTTPSSYNCPKVNLLDDPLRNVLRLFRSRNPRRVRRNPPSFRRRRRIWVYKPKHGLRKVNFRSKKYASSLK